MANYPWWQNRNPFSVSAGELRHQVQIQSPPVAKNDAGEPTGDWMVVLTALAGIASLAQREVYQTGQFSGQLTHKITLRWPGEGVIASGMRVVFGQRTFVIQAPPDNVQERNRLVNLLCLEIDGGGQNC